MSDFDETRDILEQLEQALKDDPSPAGDVRTSAFILLEIGRILNDVRAILDQT